MSSIGFKHEQAPALLLVTELLENLILHKRIKTTESRAKELRRYIEPLVTKAKKGDLNSIRMITRKIRHKNILGILSELFFQISKPLLAAKPSLTLYRHISFPVFPSKQTTLFPGVDVYINPLFTTGLA